MDIMQEANRIAREAKEKVRLTEEKKAELRRKVQQAKERVEEALPAVIALTPTIVVAGQAALNVAGTINRMAEKRSEANRRNRMVYDRSAMHYWNLKWKLTNKDWTTINQRKSNGENLGDILREMKLLK